MSAVTHVPAASPDRSREIRPGLPRLVRVELRKAYDTRAGFWLLLSAVLLAALVAGLTVFTGADAERDLATTLDYATQAINFLVPVVGILLVTSEWSQRTAQVTFTLVPRRGRVLAAKVGAAVVLALAAFAATLVLAALFTALGGRDGEGVWSLSAGVLAQTALFDVISMLIGLAFGAAILLSAPAIVASFVLPIGLTLVMNLVSGLDEVGDWVDQGEALSPLTSHALSGHEWLQALVCAALWLGVPLAIGLGRFVRGEVR